jgi:phosphatidate phosphatase PAH1
MGRLASRWLSIFGTAALLLACGSSREGFGDETPKGDGPTKNGDKAPGTDGTKPPPTSDQKCAPMPACNSTSSPTLGPKRDFKHTSSSVIVFSGDPHHRGRDQIVIEGQPQWVIGKFTYSMNDKDLKDEEVDIYLERDCSGKWEKLGTATTTSDDQHPEVEGVPDTGGRIYFEIPKDKTLALGRHRVRLVVAGDQSSKATSVFVSDVDGTLTESENAEYPALLSGDLPEAQPDAPAVLKALADRGYRPIYVTARPEWLTGRTREFLDKHNFPRGIIHTTTGLTGALNGAASDFKSRELQAFVAKGLTIAWAFGNRASDTDAYEAAKIEPKDHRIFLQVDDKNGGKRIEAYKDILPAVTAAPKACQ